MTTEHRVMGMISNGDKMRPAMLTVRITKDEIGKSLSISDDKTILLLIPLEPVEKRLKEVVG